MHIIPPEQERTFNQSKLSSEADRSSEDVLHQS